MVRMWKRSEPTTVTKVGYRSLVEKTFTLPNGRPYSFTTYYSEGAKAVAVIALTPDRKVIIARQFRPGPESIMDELPGGMVEKDEDPEVAALRELAEETGYRPVRLQYLGSNCREPYSNLTSYYYLAMDCALTGDGQSLDEHENSEQTLLSSHEDIEVGLLPIKEFLEVAKAGRLTDPAAVLYAYDTLIELDSAA